MGFSWGFPITLLSLALLFHSSYNYPIGSMYGIIYIYLHFADFYGFHVGEYTSPMDPMGIVGAHLVGNCIRRRVHSEKSMHCSNSMSI